MTQYLWNVCWLFLGLECKYKEMQMHPKCLVCLEKWLKYGLKGWAATQLPGSLCSGKSFKTSKLNFVWFFCFKRFFKCVNLTVGVRKCPKFELPVCCYPARSDKQLVWVSQSLNVQWVWGRSQQLIDVQRPEYSPHRASLWTPGTSWPSFGLFLLLKSPLRLILEGFTNWSFELS